MASHEIKDLAEDTDILKADLENIVSKCQVYEEPVRLNLNCEDASHSLDTVVSKDVSTSIKLPMNVWGDEAYTDKNRNIVTEEGIEWPPPERWDGEFSALSNMTPQTTLLADYDQNWSYWCEIHLGEIRKDQKIRPEMTRDLRNRHLFKRETGDENWKQKMLDVGRHNIQVQKGDFAILSSNCDPSKKASAHHFHASCDQLQLLPRETCEFSFTNADVSALPWKDAKSSDQKCLLLENSVHAVEKIYPKFQIISFGESSSGLSNAEIGNKDVRKHSAASRPKQPSTDMSQPAYVEPDPLKTRGAPSKSVERRSSKVLSACNTERGNTGSKREDPSTRFLHNYNQDEEPVPLPVQNMTTTSKVADDQVRARIAASSSDLHVMDGTNDVHDLDSRTDSGISDHATEDCILGLNSVHTPSEQAMLADDDSDTSAPEPAQDSCDGVENERRVAWSAPYVLDKNRPLLTSVEETAQITTGNREQHPDNFKPFYNPTAFENLKAYYRLENQNIPDPSGEDIKTENNLEKYRSAMECAENAPYNRKENADVDIFSPDQVPKAPASEFATQKSASAVAAYGLEANGCHHTRQDRSYASGHAVHEEREKIIDEQREPLFKTVDYDPQVELSHKTFLVDNSILEKEVCRLEHILGINGAESSANFDEREDSITGVDVPTEGLGTSVFFGLQQLHASLVRKEGDGFDELLPKHAALNYVECAARSLASVLHGRPFRLSFVVMESCSELWRLSSFYLLDDLVVSPIRLAQSGFYYDQTLNEIKCFSCGVRKRQWSESEKKVWMVHLTISPDCLHVQFKDTRNIPIDEGGEQTVPLLADSDQVESPIRSDSQRSAGPITSDGNGNDPQVENWGQVDTDGDSQTIKRDVSQGRRSFHPSEAKATERSAERGSFSGQVSSAPGTWSLPAPCEDHDSIAKHREYAARSAGTAVPSASICPHLSDFRADQVPNVPSRNFVTFTTTQVPTLPASGAANKYLRFPVPVTDTRASTSSRESLQTDEAPCRGDGARDDLDNSQAAELDDAVPAGLDMRRAASPLNARPRARLLSFVGWPASSGQSPRSLALAGFHYLGSGDSVRCWFCGIILRNWRQCNDPWVTHALFRFSCDFLLAVRGQSFITQALITRGYENNNMIVNGSSSVSAPTDGQNSGTRQRQVSGGNPPREIMRIQDAPLEVQPPTRRAPVADSDNRSANASARTNTNNEHNHATNARDDSSYIEESYSDRSRGDALTSISNASNNGRDVPNIASRSTDDRRVPAQAQASERSPRLVPSAAGRGCHLVRGNQVAGNTGSLRGTAVGGGGERSPRTSQGGSRLQEPRGDGATDEATAATGSRHSLPTEAAAAAAESSRSKSSVSRAAIGSDATTGSGQSAARAGLSANEHPQHNPPHGSGRARKGKNKREKSSISAATSGTDSSSQTEGAPKASFNNSTAQTLQADSDSGCQLANTREPDVESSTGTSRAEMADPDHGGAARALVQASCVPLSGATPTCSRGRTAESEDADTYYRRLLDENRRLRERRMCKICGRNAIDTIFLPCGHLCTCNMCATTIRECCLCYQRIRGTAHVHME